MIARVLAPLGAMGLGVLAIVLCCTGGDGTTPLAVSPLDQEDGGTDVAPPASDARPETEPGPRSAPTLESLVSTDPALERPGPLREEERRRRAERGLSAGSRLPRPRAAHLAVRPRWTRFLETWLFLPEMPEATGRLARIQTALEAATNPVVRQNLIFLAALALPADVSGPWLQALCDSADAADAEDALVALAFSGDRPARAAFQDLARSPSTAKVHRILDSVRAHDALAQTGSAEAREVLRSYRAVEANDRAPYFAIVAFDATHDWGYERGYRERMGWVPGTPMTPREQIALYEAFLARYPGHPGSDDLARRIGSLHRSLGDVIECVRWYSRAATLPDQDKAYAAATLMASLCETVLTPEDLLLLSEDQGLATPNRNYFQYVWLRRLASDRGMRVATDAWATLAVREPDSELGVAWARRFLAPVPAGLDRGLTPLPPGDPLRRLDRKAPPWPLSKHPARRFERVHGMYTGFSWAEETWRLAPWPEVAVLHRERITRQARAWLTLAELERRTHGARGTTRADLLYKQAAVFYHDRDVLFPAYGYHTMTFGSRMRWAVPDRGESEGADRGRETVLRFERSSFSYLRAVDLFQRIEAEHPDYPALDKVVFSQGMLWKRLAEYRPYYAWSPSLEQRWRGRQDPAVRSLVESFERCARSFPESPLADDALAAARYWRRMRPRLFTSD